MILVILDYYLHKSFIYTEVWKFTLNTNISINTASGIHLLLGIISFVAEDGEQQYQRGNPPVSADGTEAVQIDGIQTANAGIAGMLCSGNKDLSICEFHNTSVY